MGMNPEDSNSEVQRVVVIVGCVVKQDNKYLMVQERSPKLGDVWRPPSGKVNVGEDFESATVRIAKEQTGYDVRLKDEVGFYHELVPRSVKHIYSAAIAGGDIHPTSPEILKVVWMPFAEIEILEKANQLRAPWVWDVLQKSSGHGGAPDGSMQYL